MEKKAKMFSSKKEMEEDLFFFKYPIGFQGIGKQKEKCNYENPIKLSAI